ncbi:hypothetical protein [Micromonospora sp. DT47]|uniref:hypothetical protein n=1 Tax=Micromonospora sp. DT47 TaxID=3393431 RepID=UPI003CEA3695
MSRELDRFYRSLAEDTDPRGLVPPDQVRQQHHHLPGGPNGRRAGRAAAGGGVGDVVTVLWERGWESGSSPRAQVDADSRAAAEAVRDWWD